ncbi:rcc01693 family protein [Paramesorhizobium deserti]|uniref:rcc01693 family protein n=1 Tax=Paramesorhizobium deserti TaxID=1494590 RepID=UPI00244EBCE5|nr:rcc01693 family protein [Paramesorhizobium deserti]
MKAGKRFCAKPLRAAAESAPPFPWDAAMQAGLGHLRLSPKTFWAMTPRELAAALGLTARAANAPSREAFDALCQAFPDR